MEFLTQQKIVRVPANRVKALILTIKTILSDSGFGTNFSFSFGQLSAAADLILLGRLHFDLCKCAYYWSGNLTFFP